MKLLTFSTLYPDRSRPRHGIFVETRLRQLLAQNDMEAVVLAPVPWFPFAHPAFGEYATYAQVPAHEMRHGLSVLHPRYAVIPKFGMTLAPWLMAMAAFPKLKRIAQDGYRFDVIDAHYFYPDGVAAALLGRWLGKPVVITARGTDIHLISGYRLPRRMIRWAARHCAAIVTVSQALKNALIEIGVDDQRATVLRNGVDLDVFRPVDRERARSRLGITGTTLLSVGLLIERKGHHIAIEALRELPECRLLIVGDGPLHGKLKTLAETLGVAARVRIEPTAPQEELVHYYSAADALVLASSREGMPNVVLEALACGTPIVATAIGGIPEIVASPEAGMLMAERSSCALVASVRHLMANYPMGVATRRYAEGFGWQETTQGLHQLFTRVVAEHAA